ncbi:hypothetical protein PSD17_05580 [Pseudonocardia sp. D17]|nr:hypothetical protein PSD17_05580 [Pseudonocardia sp. D17]
MHGVQATVSEATGPAGATHEVGPTAGTSAMATPPYTAAEASSAAAPTDSARWRLRDAEGK